MTDAITHLFSAVLDMSATAAVVIAVVSLVRLPLSRAPKSITCALWFVALFRLLCPVSFESALSLFYFRISLGHRVPVFSPVVAGTPVISASAAAFDAGAMAEPSAAAAAPPAAPALSVMTVLAFVWASVAIGLVVYGTVSYLLLRRRLGTATLVEGRIYETDRIGSPFVYGLFRPRVYLPVSLKAGERPYIIEHEKTHIKRRDYIVKPLWFFAVCLHWFNPLSWLAFFLLGRDMEISCDEAVLRKLGDKIKADYSSSLLALSSPRAFLNANPLAFGEGGMLSRVKKVLNFKRPVASVILVAVIAAAGLTVALAANPKGPETEPSLAARFLSYKTDYVGDNSKVGGIVGLLEYPAGTACDHFELQTGKEPFGVTIVLDASGAARERWESKESRVLLERNAAVFLSLVKNAGFVHFDFNNTENGNIYTVAFKRDVINSIYGPDVCAYAGDEASLERLLSLQVTLPPTHSPPAGKPGFSYGFVKIGPDGVAVAMALFDEGSKKLAEDVIANYMMISSALPAVHLPSLDAYYTIAKNAEDGSRSEYYAFSRDGRAWLQAGQSGQRSVIDDKLFAALKELIDSKTVPIIIDQNLSAIMSSPATSSNPGDYIRAHQAEYDNILKMGNPALSYMLSCFNNGEGNTLKGYIMMYLCSDLLGISGSLEGQYLFPDDWFARLKTGEEAKLPDDVYTGNDPESGQPYRDG